MHIFKNFSISVLLFITAFSPLVSTIPTVSATRTIDSANLGGKQSVTVKKNSLVNVNMTVTSTSPSNWFSTKYKIGNNEWICIDTANHNRGTTATIKFQVKAPARPGKYTILLKAYGGNDCTLNHGSPIITLTDGIVIEGEVIPPKPKGDLSEYSAVILNYPESSASNFTNASWQAYQQALNTNIVTGDNTQTEIDTAVNNIKIAQSLLLKKSNLNSYNGVLLAYPESFSYLYTNASWSTYKTILDANAVTTEDTQERVDDATQKISEAQKNIITKADLTEYRKVLELVPVEAKNNYTEESWDAYVLVLEANRNLTSENTQTEIDNAVDILKKAQSLLVRNDGGELQDFDPTVSFKLILKNTKTPLDPEITKAKRLEFILNGLDGMNASQLQQKARKKVNGKVKDLMAQKSSESLQDFEVIKNINDEMAEVAGTDANIEVSSFMTLQDYAPNDPKWNEQWYLHYVLETNKNIWKSSKVGIQNLPIVAVIDAGVDFSHPDLSLVKWKSDSCLDERGESIGSCDGGYDFVGDDKDPYPTDGYSHGTAVASLISASSDDGEGMASLSRGNASVMSLRVADYGLLDTDNIVRAILFAVHNGAKVINMSFAGPTYSRQLEEAIRYAQDHGVYMVASAGNYGLNIDETKIYPASFNNGSLITAGSIDKNGQITPWSNYGKIVDVFAPGADIFSATNGNQYKFVSGTSFSAPIVTSYLVAKLNDGVLPKKAIEQISKVSALAEYSKSGKVLGGGRALSGAPLVKNEIDIKLKKDTEGNFINPQSKAGEIVDPKTFVPENFSLQALSAPQLLSPGSVIQPGIGATLVNGKITFFWTSVSGASQYGVHVRDNVTGQLIIDCNWPSCNFGTNYTPGYTFVPGREYRWNMVAYEPNGTKGIFSSLFYFTVVNPITPPSVPSNLTPGSLSADGPVLSSTSINLAWNPAVGASAYNVDFVDRTTGQTWNYGTGSVNSKSVSVVSGHKYSFRVLAVNTAGNSSYSPYSYFQIQSPQNTAPTIPVVHGQSSTDAYKDYIISLSSTDPNNDQVWYQTNWGDGSTTSTNFSSSGFAINTSHIYTTPGTYCVTARVFDQAGLGSSSSPCLYVTVKAIVNNPTLSITPVTQTIDSGTYGQITISTTNAYDCSQTSQNPYSDQYFPNPNATYWIGPMIATTTFLVECFGPEGNTVFQNYTIIVRNSTIPKVTFGNIPNTRNGDTNTMTLTTTNIPIGSIINIVPLMGNINPQSITTTGGTFSTPFVITSATGSIVIGVYYKDQLVGTSNSFTVSNGAGCLADADLARQDLASFIDLEKGEIKSSSSLEGLCLPPNPDLAEPYLVSPGSEDKNNPEVVYGANQTVEIAYVPNAVRYEVNIRDISVNNELTVYKTTGQFIDVTLKEGHNYSWNANAFDSQGRSGWFTDRKYFNVRSNDPNTPPTINVSPTSQTILEGTDGHFILSSTNTTTCDITGAGLVNFYLANGNYGIGPMYQTTVFDFRCLGSNNQYISQSITINVNKKEVPPPPPGVSTISWNNISQVQNGSEFDITLNTQNIPNNSVVNLSSSMGNIYPKTVAIQNNQYVGKVKLTSAINQVKLTAVYPSTGSWQATATATSNEFSVTPACSSSLQDFELEQFELNGLCTPKNINLTNPEQISPGKYFSSDETAKNSSVPEVSSTTQTFSWDTVNGASKYALYVRNMTTGILEVDEENLTTNSYTANLKPNSLYYWHTRAKDAQNQGGWLSEKLYFKTKPQEITPTECTTDCFSNVMFFPGIMGSRLYEEKIDNTDLDCKEKGNCFKDKQLWVSFDVFSDEQERMALNSEGKKIVDVYTKNDTQKLKEDENETGIVDGVSVLNIYKSFIGDLRNWKINGTISDYALIPYDWRLSLDDILNNGKVGERNKLSYTEPQDFSESFILKNLRELQRTSKSGKVTLIGHSNGGLVIKALIQKLKDNNDPLYNQIDKVILVATPQVGTPEGLLSLLHGTRIFMGVVMSAKTQRYLAENMPTTYNLLPSKEYFESNTEKLITFPNHELFQKQIDRYDTDISNFTELKEYVLGREGRIKPSEDDLDNPNKGNETLYNNAEQVHQMLDNWQAPANTKVIQIGGWGESTLAGIEYVAKNDPICISIVCTPLVKKIMYPKPRFTDDGDATVISSSALWMKENLNTENWWINLNAYKDGNRNSNHKNILEVQNLRNLIKSEITNTFYGSDNIITRSKPAKLAEESTKLNLSLFTIGTIGIRDEKNRYTGIDSNGNSFEEIPNSRYVEIGNTKYISVPSDISYILEINPAEDVIMDIDKSVNNKITESKTLILLKEGTGVLKTEIPSNIDISTIELKNN